MSSTNEELAMRIRSGETALLPELWERIRCFVYQEAIRFYSRCSDRVGADVDDLAQSGYFALLSAIRDYDADSEFRFLSFLSYHLKTEFRICAGIRTKKAAFDPINLKSSVSLDEPVSSDPDGMTYADVLPDPDDGIAAAEHKIWLEQLRSALDNALSQLPEALEETIRNRYYRGLTVEETAREMSLTASEARKAEARALGRLRRPKQRQNLEAFVDANTLFYRSVGIQEFNSTHTSSTEKIVLKREAMRQERRSG